MNKFSKIYRTASIFFVYLFVLNSCSDELVTDSRVSPTEQNVNKKMKMPWIPGEVYVKLATPDTRAIQEVSSNLQSTVPMTRSSKMVMMPVFDVSGEYADAMRREGMDKWYKINFDEHVDVQTVIDELRNNKTVEFVQGGIAVVQHDVHYTPYASHAYTTRANNDVLDANGGYAPFTSEDPFLRKQWHYQNDGIIYGFTKGADIGLFSAWNQTKGNPKVVVAIIDSGIYAEHPDLKKAMWTDDQGHNGRNFLNNTGDIDPGFHGTHVGGTIGARSNNGIGVAGIAGGDGTEGMENSGVRLMSCEIFGADRLDGSAQAAKPDQIANAFVWAAKNGAVLANCSWGYPYDKKKYGNAEDYKQQFAESNEVIRVAMKFFINNAGKDGAGRQKEDSMMDGGVIIFASGNDNTRNVDITPAYNSEVIAVGSFTPDFSLAEYTSTGDWVDVLAPGGIVELDITKGILSTVPSTFGKIKLGDVYASKYLYPNESLYAFANGTSMAAPHVTGIAALIVSKFGGKGFTKDELRKRLMAAIKPQSLEKASSDVVLRGKMGVGFIDASLALNDPEKMAPAKVQEIEVKEVNYYDATLRWSVTSDEDAVTKTAFAYDIYLLNEENGTLANPVATVYSNELSAGTKLSYKLVELESNKHYFVKIIARDRFQNKAEAAKVDFKTKENYAPKITNPLEPDFKILDTKPFFRYVFKVVDKDGHSWKYIADNKPENVTLVQNERKDELEFTVLVNGKVGKQSFDLVLVDELQGKHVEKISYEIVESMAPKQKSEFADIILGENDKPMRIELEHLFQTSSGIEPIYEVTIDNGECVIADIVGDALVLTPKKEGVATVLLTSIDGYKKTVSTIRVKVIKNNSSDIQALYPLPAHSCLKIGLKGGLKEVNVMVTSMRGEVLKDEKLLVKQYTYTATLSVDRLVPGVYNLIVKTDRNTSKITFIKNW